MGKNKERLAVFVGQADEDFQSRFITGFTKQAFARKNDVCIFSMYKKYQDTAEREMGESNILTLANPDFFDGIVILKDTIQTPFAAEELEKKLKNSYSGPVLVIDKESNRFRSISIDGYTPVLELTNHLIEDHGVKDIAFLTGKKKHPHSLERLNAFKTAMNNHKLEVPNYRIIEGDFWYSSGEQCADYIVSSGLAVPQAVICANTAMAIGLCKALAELGINVPEDIIVVGADATEEGMTSPKIITSYQTPAQEFGSYAVDVLRDMKLGRKSDEFEGVSKLILGETCGCNKVIESGYHIRRKEWSTVVYEEGFESINNTIYENLMSQTTIEDYVGAVYSYAYQIKGAKRFDLCLVNGIANIGEDESLIPKNEGYTETMIHAIKYTSDQMDNVASLERTFEVKDMLPGLLDDTENPAAYFFTPVFYEDKCFGYAVVSYGDSARSYDELYRKWIKTVCLGFEALRRYMVTSVLKERISNLKSSKFSKSEADFECLSSEEKEDYKLVQNIIDNNLLSYKFQPIVRAEDGSIYSYEALMRSHTRKNVPPLVILKYAGMQERFPDIESATFKNVIDIVEANKDKIGDAKIFINSIPGVKVDDYDQIARRLSANSDTIVVELTEESELDDADLNRLKEFFASINVEIAVDDYGTGYSNISNLLRYLPNYVKIDRSLLSEIQNKPQKQHFVREIIEFCHNNQIMALAEGVETSEELRTVIHLGADLIQGFYTGRPEAEFVKKIDEKIINEIKSYYQERSDGKAKRVYIAGRTNRVSLLPLSRDGCTDIIIGSEEMVYNDITIVGTPSLKTDIHMRIEAGYSGTVTIENVYFSNIKGRPCIEIGENCDVTLIIEGQNVLKDAGILVPETSTLTVEGKGNMNIELDNTEAYCIGNDLYSKHGDISLQMSGILKIQANTRKGVCIGSGLGGRINISGGACKIFMQGNDGVAIGAIDGTSEVNISSCGVEVELSLRKGVCIGSLYNDSNTYITQSSVKLIADGREICCIGSYSGKKCYVNIYNAFTECYLRADTSTCIGTFAGDTVLDVNIASLRIDNAGLKALSVGGYEGSVKVNLSNVDTRINVHNSLEFGTMAKDEEVIIINGRYRELVNDSEVERKLIFKFDSTEE